ncbi:MAG: helicase-associated domain-containing protein [Deltaproteobacteria bacterium]|nr:helicase-associated domain-containing protein [Deltaproteobacteria bacterium]
MRYVPENPLIIQSDHTLLLETMGPNFRAARDSLVRFAELVKSPEYVHTYRVTPLSLWNAASWGLAVDEVLGTLEKWAKYDIPPNVPVSIRQTMARWGRLQLHKAPRGLKLVAAEPVLLTEICSLKPVQSLLGKRVNDTTVLVDPRDRGEIKQVLAHAGHPVEDLAGYRDGAALEMQVLPETKSGVAWGLREYQRDAVDSFFGDSVAQGGSGVVVLPCGAGKTMVGIAAMARLGMKTLVLCTNVTALRQWKSEIIERSSLTEDDVSEYSGEVKDIKSVTLSTYQMLTFRRSRNDEFVHFGLFNMENWGLVIYDEVHLLPAPIFRAVAHLQARRRLGLTATLVREDGKETDVFALIGPKRYDVPWKDLEHQGWIASATCTEVRVDFSDDDRLRYAVADDREKFRIASVNARKLPVIEELLEQHQGDRILVLGMYVDQLEWLSRRLGFPLIEGKTPQKRRDELFARFRQGEERVLVISKVGNFSVDLPDASVAIQVSGTWGSRQEEAQRLGRILRPKAGENKASFYSVVTRDTVEQTFGEKRQLFLTEQGYAYRIETRA